MKVEFLKCFDGRAFDKSGIKGYYSRIYFSVI